MLFALVLDFILANSRSFDFFLRGLTGLQRTSTDPRIPVHSVHLCAVHSAGDPKQPPKSPKGLGTVPKRSERTGIGWSDGLLGA